MMFVKFRKTSDKFGRIVFRCSFARSSRDQGSRSVRQTHIAYISSIAASDCSNILARAYFWTRLEAILESLDLTDSDKKAARRSASRVVPKPRLTPIMPLTS